jgi:hypothetical protein
MSGRFVLSVCTHCRPRQQRFPANWRCYVKDENVTAFTNDLPNNARSVALGGLRPAERALERPHAATLRLLVEPPPSDPDAKGKQAPTAGR